MICTYMDVYANTTHTHTHTQPQTSTSLFNFFPALGVIFQVHDTFWGWG